eukprot:6303905-Amphidinium_carterae.1
MTLNSHGWKRVSLEGGLSAWYHSSDCLRSLVAPCIVDVVESGPFPRHVADADVVIVCPDQGKGTDASLDRQMGTSNTLDMILEQFVSSSVSVNGDACLPEPWEDGYHNSVRGMVVDLTSGEGKLIRTLYKKTNSNVSR